MSEAFLAAQEEWERQQILAEQEQQQAEQILRFTARTVCGTNYRWQAH